MWTLIFLKDYDEYDVVPNSWIVSPDLAFYPETNAKSFARAETCPDETWCEVNILIKQRDITDYDRALENSIRFTKNRRGVTESENEVRGKQCRTKKMKIFHNYLNTDELSPIESSSEEVEESHTHKCDLTPEKVDIPPPPKSYAKTEKQKLSSKTKIATKCVESTKTTNSVEALLKTKPRGIWRKAGQQCRLPDYKKHDCSFKATASMAHQMCLLSSQVTALQSKLLENNKLLQSLLSVDNTRKQESEEFLTNSVDVSNGEISTEVLQILAKFPFQTIENFKKFDTEVQADAELRNNTVRAFVARAKSSSYSRSTTSILSAILTENVVPHFTFHGQSRSDHTMRKEAFSRTTVCSLVIVAVKLMWKGKVSVNLKEAVETCIKGWFSQTQTKINKGERKRQENELS